MKQDALPTGHKVYRHTGTATVTLIYFCEVVDEWLKVWMDTLCIFTIKKT
jgi:hypothetical protein